MEMGISLGVAALTLAGVACGRLSGVQLERAGFALVGAALLLITGLLDLETAVGLIDTEVLALLFGLILLREALAEVGFFRGLMAWATRRASSPFVLLASLALVSGVLSAPPWRARGQPVGSRCSL